MDNFMDHLASELGQAGWHDLGTRSHLGIIFELVGSRRFLFTKWNVLVRRIGSFDRDNAEIVAQEFEILSSKSKSFLWGSG